MIKRLQRKFIIISAGSLLAVVIALLAALNIANMYRMNRESDVLLKMISDNNGKFPDDKKAADRSFPRQNEEQGRMEEDSEAKNEDKGRPYMQEPFGIPISPETRFKTRYFTVLAKSDGELEINTDNIASVTEDGAEEFALNVTGMGKNSGYIGNYRYMVTDRDEGRLIVFTDCSENVRTMKTFAMLSVITGLICVSLVIILIYIFSRMAVKPVIESVNKQKRFITDAGHEIKTPLAIISANAEVIEMTAGESEWTKSIRNQVSRLNELVKNLLTLARMDEAAQHIEMAQFDMSEAVEAVVDTFAAPMQTRGISCKENIENAIIMNGNESAIGQLVTIIIDNAVKYASESSVIEVTLVRAGHRAELSVYNDCDTIPQGNLNRLFDRFYRADESRSRQTGGYGIGLSVAQAIVNTHKGRIQAVARDNGICFTIQLPIK